MRQWLPFALALAFLAGCGESQDGKDDAALSEEAAVIRAVDEANQTFAQGQYDRTCSHYTESVQRDLVNLIDAPSCPQAWAMIDKTMRQSLTPAQFDSVTSYGAESAEIDGDTATATYGEPPESLPSVLGVAKGTTVQLRKQGGRWLIARLPPG